MKVAILYDPGNADGSKGGAELTMEEYAAAMPEGVERCDVDEAETVVIGNCVTFDPDFGHVLRGKNVVRVHHDLARHEPPDLRAWLEKHADHTFCSPLHRELYGLDGPWPVIPPAIDLAKFRPTRQHKRHAKRQGAVTIGAWQNPGKGQQLLAEWAAQNESLDVYGTGELAPVGQGLNYKGPLEYPQVPEVLWRYETFVHLPTAPEPFGRGVAEAWAAGCKCVTNSLVGARYWIEKEPDKLATAAEDFWEYVL